jgi:hypothetical protein
MTIIDAYQLLNEYFNSNTVFTLKKNRKEVVVISDDEDGENAALFCALAEMEKGGILRSSEIGGEKYWVLYKSLESFSQTIEISAFVAAGIASVINGICDKLGTDSEKCDPKDVTEKDLKNLIYMASKVSAEDLKK